MKYRVDQGKPDQVALGICECGQRFLALDRQAALTRLALHEAVWHPHDKNVRSRLTPSQTRRTTPKR